MVLSFESLSVGNIFNGDIIIKKLINIKGTEFKRVYVNIKDSDDTFTSFIFNLHELYYEKLEIRNTIKVKIIKKLVDKNNKNIVNLAYIPDKKLLGLDLNGILLKRKYESNKEFYHYKVSKPFNFFKDFLNYCCTNFDVIIWTCCEERNLEHDLLSDNNFIQILNQNSTTLVNGRSSVVSDKKPLFLKEISVLNNTLERNHCLHYDSNILLIDNHEEKFERNQNGSGLIFNENDIDENFLSENGLFRNILNYYDNDDNVIDISSKLLDDNNYKKYIWSNQTLSRTSSTMSNTCSNNTDKFLISNFSNTCNSSTSFSNIRSFRDSHINYDSNNILKEKFIKQVVNNDKVNTYLKYSNCPGIRAQNLTKVNYTQILNDKYLVCEKTDGVRFMLYMEDGDSYLIDRALNFFKIEVNKSFYKNCTILDGELVIQKHGGIDTLVYLIFDVVKFDGEETDSLKEGLYHRLSFLNGYFSSGNSDIILNFIDTKPREFINYNNIKIKKKEFCKLSEIETICDRFEYSEEDMIYTKDGITSNCDGLVFTPELKRYSEIGNVYKWKPKFLNTIDFKINKDNFLNEQDNQISLFTTSGKLDFKFCDISKNNENPIYQDIRIFFERGNYDLIVECSNNEKGWDIKSIRTDKSKSNSINTTFEIMNLLLNPLELNEIISYTTSI